jgi:hypothetical protein
VDVRLQRILSAQQAAGFAGLAGSEGHAVIRVSDQLINQAIAVLLPPEAAVRGATVHAHEGNWFEVQLSLAKPAFLPPISFELAIERQPQLPANPSLVLRISGGAGALARLAAPLLARLQDRLPYGIRLEHERVFVDLRSLLRHHDRAALLDYATELNVATEEAGIAVLIAIRVP